MVLRIGYSAIYCWTSCLTFLSLGDFDESAVEYEHGFELWRVFEEKLQVLKETMFNLTLSPTKLIAFCRKFRTNRVERSYATSFLILNLLRAVSNIWKMKRYQLQPSLWVNLVPRTLIATQKHDSLTFLCELLYFFVYIFRRQQSRSLFNAVVTER